MKARKYFVIPCGEKCVKQKKEKEENGENKFFKALANRFRLTSKLCQRTTKLFMDYLLVNGLHDMLR